MIKSELVIVRDKNNNPNIMRRYEKCLHREVDPSIGGDAVHPMFIIRGKEVDAIYLPEYLSCVIDGIPYSLPMQTPATRMDFDSVVECHRKKGAGWHCMTAVEWQFVADLIRLQESAGKEIIRGNTSFGGSHLVRGEKGIYPEKQDTITLTGSGSESWFFFMRIQGNQNVCLFGVDALTMLRVQGLRHWSWIVRVLVYMALSDSSQLTMILKARQVAGVNVRSGQVYRTIHFKISDVEFLPKRSGSRSSTVWNGL